MDTRQECLNHLFRFVQSGNIDEAAVAGGTILAYLATLEGKTVQLAALARLREELTKRLEKTGVADEAEDRHTPSKTHWPRLTLHFRSRKRASTYTRCR